MCVCARVCVCVFVCWYGGSIILLIFIQYTPLHVQLYMLSMCVSVCMYVSGQVFVKVAVNHEWVEAATSLAPPSVTVGKYPVEAVHMMASVCREAEVAMFHQLVFTEIRDNTPTPTETGETIAIAAVNAAYSQNAGAIICLTTTGRCVCVCVLVYVWRVQGCMCMGEGKCRQCFCACMLACGPYCAL